MKMVQGTYAQLLFDTKERVEEFKKNSDLYNKEAIINDYLFSINKIIDYCEKRGRF